MQGEIVGEGWRQVIEGIVYIENFDYYAVDC